MTMEQIHFVPSSQRYRIANFCPCGKSNKDGKFCPDRENPANGYCQGCGKTFLEKLPEKLQISYQPKPEMKPSFIERPLMLKSQSRFNDNNFLKYCQLLLPDSSVENMAQKYGVGTSLHYGGGSTVFWQQDIEGNIRAGKIINYDPKTGKRNKEVSPAVSWVHSVLKLNDFRLKQCLFGEHLLQDNSKSIAVVESEKTAFIMSLIDESRTWVATGAKDNFKYDLLQPLKGRKVVAYPDNGEYETWKQRAEALTIYGINITVSDKFIASTKPKGWDLADEVADEVKQQKNKVNTSPAIKYSDSQVIAFADQFTDKEMFDIAELIIPECDARSENEILKALKELENISDVDGKYFIKAMLYRGVISKGYPGYYLSKSTPF